MKRVHDAATVRKSTGLDLGKLHHSLFSLERELSSLTSAGTDTDTLLKLTQQTCVNMTVQ